MVRAIEQYARGIKRYFVRVRSRVSMPFAKGPAITSRRRAMSAHVRRTRLDTTAAFSAVQALLFPALVISVPLLFVTGRFVPEGPLADRVFWIVVVLFSLRSLVIGRRHYEQPFLPLVFFAAIYPFASTLAHAAGAGEGISGDDVHAAVLPLAVAFGFIGLIAMLPSSLFAAVRDHGWLGRQRDLFQQPVPAVRLWRFMIKARKRRSLHRS